MRMTHSNCATFSLAAWLSELVEGMTTSRTALVTGANQGLGRALVEGLAAGMARRTASCSPAATQTASSAAAAAVADGPAVARVEGRVLDVRDGDAIAALADELGESTSSSPTPRPG